jgi:hypothetical protein
MAGPQGPVFFLPHPIILSGKMRYLYLTQNGPKVRCLKDRYNRKVTTEEERVKAAPTMVFLTQLGYFF